MGLLLYANDDQGVEFDDRTLAHLKLVIIGKLRRQESFALSWARSQASGSGRETIWLSPSIPLRFWIDNAEAGPLNRAWLDLLAQSAERGDLRVTAEPVEEAP
ncbi:DUF7882 family protein [Herbiconiux solani]|uniref:DUF7882 family protein n=1 Tax=Herbiconiux solani TaxID=661329 RepID=UPI00082444DA|nr:hypothetical protein [Herbiconiux solani]